MNYNTHTKKYQEALRKFQRFFFTQQLSRRESLKNITYLQSNTDVGSGKMLRSECLCQFCLWLGIAIYVVLFTSWSWARYDRYGSTGFDLAIFDQATWLISKGQTPFVTVRGLHILADHFSGILYLLAPLYWMWSSPKALLVVQSLALALGAWPVYNLARRQTDAAPIALLFAFAYLLYPAVQWSNLCDFHPDMIAVPLLLGAIYYAHLRQWRKWFMLLGVAALTKETVGLTIVLLGLWLCFRRERRVGAATLAFGFASLFVALATMRYFASGQPSPYLWLYRDYGNTPAAIIGNVFGRPLTTTAQLNTELNRGYIIDLLQPLAFLPLLAPEILWIAVPALLSSLLSSRIWMHNVYSWYTPLITPILFTAAINGFTRCQRWKLPLVTNGLLIYLCLGLCFGAANSPFFRRSWPLINGLSSLQAKEANGLLQIVPANASISAPSVLLPHLSRRHNVYNFPNPFYQCGWGATVLALRQQDGEGYSANLPEQYAQAANAAPVAYVVLCPIRIHSVPSQIYRDQVFALLRSPAYGLVAVERELLLFQRGANHTDGLRLLAQRAGVQKQFEFDVERNYDVWERAQPF